MKALVNRRTHDAATIFNIGLILATISLGEAIILTAAQPADESSLGAIAGLPLLELAQLAIGCLAGMALILSSLWLRIEQLAINQDMIGRRLCLPSHYTVAFQRNKVALPQSSEPSALTPVTSTGTERAVPAGASDDETAVPSAGPSYVPAISRSPLPQVLLPRKLLVAMHDHINAFAAERGDHLEIGGMLVGECEVGAIDHPPLLRLHGLIDAGPNADCQPCSLLMDEAHLARQFQSLQLQHRNLVSLGMYHLHPEHYDRCSSGDLRADREAVMNSGTGVMVFAIVTRNNPREDDTSLRHGDLKFNFFIMSHQTDLEYQAILPKLVDAPMLTCSPALARFVAMRPDTARADWMLLQRMTGIGRVELFEVEQGTHAGLWFTLATKAHSQSIHICLQNEGAVRMFSGMQEAPTREFRGVWNNPEVGPHIFISQLALQVLGQLGAETHKPPVLRHYTSLLHDQRRLVAEVRAMDDRYRKLATLMRDGDNVYWLCTIRQSGKELRVKIIYPPTYPHTPPELHVLDRLAPSPHLIGGNRICWIDVYGAHSDWNPGRDTAAVALTAAYRWFACYLIYQTLGKWPEEADD